MRNTVYYIKPTNNNFSEAIKNGLLKALSIITEKGYSNIKFVVTGISVLDNPPNYISQALDIMSNGQGVDLNNQLKKNRGFSIPDFPTAGQTTGINLVLSNSNPSFIDEKTVVVLLWANEDSLKKIQSSLSFTEIDLVAVVWNETPILNELLSASKGTRFPNGVPDPNVSPYINTFTQPINDILRRLKGINITDPASHTPTRETMKSVIDELTKKRLVVSYVDFLGFLVNDVNFPLKESVELLNWKRKYFGK